MKILKQAPIRIALWILAIFTLVAVYNALALSSPLQAQPEPNKAETKQGADSADGTNANAGKTKSESSLGGMLISSGFFGVLFYIVLGIFSVVALAVTIERAINLRRNKIIPAEFAVRLETQIRNGNDNPSEFRELCERFPSPIARILRSATVRAGRPLLEIEKAMEDSMLREVAGLRSRIRVLSVIAGTAPLVGLLGTVVGMIFAFRVSSQAGLGKAELLAEGIYLALMTTAAGLTIAIPCMLLGAWFNARVERYMWDIDETLLSTLPSFTRCEEFEAGKPVVQPEPPHEEPSSPTLARQYR